MSKDDHTQIYEMLSVLFLTLSKGQQQQQCIRQVITSHPFFSPMALFKYISKNGTVIKKQHLIQFLEENKEVIQEEQIKNIIQYQPGKKCWQYRDFLEFIYPFNSAVLREVNNMHLKRYPKLQKYGAPESSVAGFLLLLTEQIALLRKLQTQKIDSLQKISKERMRKVFLSIKKAGEKQPSHCQNDDTRITSLQLRNFMRAFVSVEDSHFLYLSRRLNLRNGYVLIENLEKFIKSTKKVAKKSINKPIKGTPKKAEALGSNQKSFNQQKYKESILEQLANNVSEKSIKPNTYNLKQQPQNQRSTLISTNNRQQSKLKRQEPVPHKIPLNDNYFMEPSKKETTRTVSSPKDLLTNFVQIFLPAAKRLEELKVKLAQHRLDYFKLFKIIDRSSRGVAGAEDLYEYYRWAGGKMHYKPQEFQLLIERYAQSDEPWITLTQFCEMVRAEDKEGNSRAPPNLGGEVHDLVVKIIQIEILSIRRQFRRQQASYLFNLINRQNTGFINYQELKKFLAEAGLHLSMHDLMAVLKRLDRSRNGVVVEHQFVSYFRPPEEF